MKYKLVFNLLGKVLMLEAALMLPSLVTSIIYGDGDLYAFIFSILITAFVGGLFTLIKVEKDDKMFARDGFLTVSLSWIALSLFGALPFYISGAIPNIMDCIFESISGFTTTGSTILTEVESLPHGILLWRSFTHWIGGMGVLVFTLALIPSMGGRMVHLLRAESPGPSPGKLVPKIADTAKILYLIYIVLTIVEMIFLLFGGMNLFDAIIHSVGTAGTGGFSNKNAGIMAFDSIYIDIVITVFMFIFSVNFSIYFQMALGNIKQALKNEELKFFLLIAVISIALITFDLSKVYGSPLQALRHAAFQVGTIMSTTGFASADFNLWPQFSKGILLFLMFMGACAGSTAGGIKIIRILMMFKAVKCEFKKQIHPRSINIIKIDGKAIEKDSIYSVMLFFFCYMAIVIIAFMIVGLDGFDFSTTFTSVITAVSNVGPGFSMVGAVGNFSEFSILSKAILSVCMLIGRLEIYPLVLLFYIPTWKK